VIQSAGLKSKGLEGEKEAERAVLSVWPHCWPDTAPFDEIY
jgi:hypothetical protein